MDSGKDYYGVLGISNTEANAGIHRAYRRLAKDCHPDRAGDQGTQKFQEIQEAYEVLSDPEKRRRYDEHATPVRQSQCPHAEPLGRPRPPVLMSRKRSSHATRRSNPSIWPSSRSVDPVGRLG